MLKKLLMLPLILGVVSTAACTTPPINTPKSTLSLTIGHFYPNLVDGTTVVIPPTPSYRIPGQTINIPAQAKQFNVSSGTLNVAITNKTKITLGMTFYLGAGDSGDAYLEANKVGTLTVAPGATEQISPAFDPALLKNNTTLLAGADFNTPGSNGEALSFNSNDGVDVTTWVTAQAKLL